MPIHQTTTAVDWPERTSREPFSREEIQGLAAHARAARERLGLAYGGTIVASEKNTGWYVPCVTNLQGWVHWQGPTAYYDPRAAYDAALACAQHYDAIVADGPNTYINYYFKVRDGLRQHFISGLPLPGDEPQIVRGCTFVECSFNCDATFTFIDCVFVCCNPYDMPVHDLLINCVTVGPLV